MSKSGGNKFISIRLSMSQDELDSFLASVPGARNASGSAGIYIAMMIAEGMLRIDRVRVAELMRDATKDRIARQINKRVRVSSNFTCLLSLYETLPSGVKAETIGCLIKKAISIYMDENPRDTSMLIDLATQRMEEITLTPAPDIKAENVQVLPAGINVDGSRSGSNHSDGQSLASMPVSEDVEKDSAQSIFMSHAKTAKMAAKMEPDEIRDLADLEALLQFDDMTPPVKR